MALTTNPKVWKLMLAIFILLTLCFAVLFYFETIFLTLIAGIILIIATENYAKEFRAWVERKNIPPWRQRLYAWLLILFWLFVALLILSNGITAISTIEFRDGGERLIDGYKELIEPRLPAVMTERLQSGEWLQRLSQAVLSALSTFFSLLSNFVINGVLIIPLLFILYFRKGAELKRRLFDLMPAKFRRGFARAATDISGELHDYLEAKVTQSLVLAAITCLGFYVAGVKGWFLLGIFGGFMNIVPYIGPWIGAVPAVIVSLLDDPIAVIIVLITVVVAQVIDNFYLQTFFIAEKVQIDALLSIILVLVGAKLLGALGMIFAIPIYIVYKIVLRESYQELVKIYK